MCFDSHARRRAGVDTRQDPIRFRNLLRQAADQLSGYGIDEDGIRRFLKPLEQRLGDEGFWRHQTGGLAVFRTAETVDWVQTLSTLPEVCVCGPHFHIKPLLRLVTAERSYLILTPSAAGMHLYHAEAEKTVDMTPDAVTEIFSERFEDRRRGGTQQHGTKLSTQFHGPGSPAEAAKKLLEERMRRADRELAGLVRASGAPVMLAGVQEAQALYRSICSFGDQVLEAGFAGNVDRLSPDELWRASWPAAEAHFRSIEDQAVEQFRAAAERARHRPISIPFSPPWRKGGRRTFLSRPAGMSGAGTIRRRSARKSTVTNCLAMKTC